MKGSGEATDEAGGLGVASLTCAKRLGVEAMSFSKCPSIGEIDKSTGAI